MTLPRRKFLQLVGNAVISPVLSEVATAQTYPSRPISMIVPFAAGGASDAIARVVAERMGKLVGQAIVIENVTGADGNIGTGRAARARPDGYTIDFGAIGTNVLNGALYSLPYDVLNDFAPISLLATFPFILFARKTLPPKDSKELIAWLKTNQNNASVGVGAPVLRVVTGLFGTETGTQFTLVAYRGGALAIQDLVAGQIDLFLGSPTQLPLMRAGSIKAYAVTSDARLAVAPDIPTFAEVGLPALTYSAWVGLFAPRGTPRDIIAKVNAAAVEALTYPSVRSRLAALGAEIFPPEGQTPEALATMVKADAAKWWPIIKEFGIKPE